MKYTQLGIEPKKLVLALPWYGYNYPCISFSGSTCEMKQVPFRGVSCSDAAGRQYCYSDLMSKFLPQAIGGRQFDRDSLTPFFNYIDDKDNKMHQIWYDDPDSLTMKYSHGITDLGLRGLAFWNIDCLNYTETARAERETRKMWDAIFVNWSCDQRCQQLCRGLIWNNLHWLMHLLFAWRWSQLIVKKARNKMNDFE